MKKDSLSWIVIQQGGSTLEFYVHGFGQLAEARAYRTSARKASYNTSEPIRVGHLSISSEQETDFMQIFQTIARETAQII